MFKKLSLLYILAFIFFSASCQEDSRRYQTNEIKVGDRVEVNPGIPGKGWLEGTVSKLNMMYTDPNHLDTYSVIIDGPNGWARSVIADHEHIRLSARQQRAKNENARNGNNEKRNVNQNQINLQMPVGCDCVPVSYFKKTGAPSANLFKNLIREIYDKQAKQGEDGSVCTIITQFLMGKPEQWIPEKNPRQIGTDRLGIKPKTIYPVKVNFIVCTTYRWAWETTTWSNATFLMFKDEKFGEWKAWGENGGSWKFENKRIEHQ